MGGVWVSQYGMHSPVRLKTDMVGILQDMCDPESASIREENREMCLAAFVEAQVSRLPRHEFLEFMRKELYSRLRDMLQRGRLQMKGGVLAVGELIEVNLLGEDAFKTRSLAGLLELALDQICKEESLSSVLDAGDDLVQLVCATLGRLVKTGGHVAAEIAAEQTKIALERVAGDPLVSYMGLRVLREMGINAPAQLNYHVEEFLQKIKFGLYHEHPRVREVALQALKACLIVVEQRVTTRREGWYNTLMENLLVDVRENTQDTKLALDVLKQVVATSGGNLLKWFEEVTQLVLSFQSSRDILIQKSVMQMLPSLAKLQPDRFAQHYFQHCFKYLLEFLNQREQEAAALASLCKTVAVLADLGEVSVLNLVIGQADVLGSGIKAVLTEQPVLEKSLEEAVKCFGVLPRLLGDAWRSHALALVHDVFVRGLSPVLLDSVKQVVEIYPEALPIVRDEVMDLVEITIGKDDPDVDDSILALEALALFDFEIDSTFLQFIHMHMDRYLYDLRCLDLRLAGCRACMSIASRCSMLPRFPRDSEQSGILESILDHIATVAVTDPCPALREEVARDLLTRDELFQQLAQDRVLTRIAYGMYDECMTAQEVFIQLVCRLSGMNHAGALPALRTRVMKVLVDLDFDGDAATAGRMIRDGAQVLGCLIRSAPDVLTFNQQRIIEMVISKLELYLLSPKPCHSIKNPGTEAVEKLLCCLCVLADVPTGLLNDYAYRIGPVLTKALLDGSSRKLQMVAVRTLEKVAGSVGHFLLSHFNSSEVVPTLLSIMDENSEMVCHDVMRALRVLGGIDPSVVEQLKSPSANEEASTRDSEGEMFSLLSSNPGVRVGSEDYYTDVSINAHLRAFKDSGGHTDYANIVRSLISLFRVLGKDSLPYMTKVIPILLNIIRSSDKELQLVLFEQLALLMEVIGPDALAYADSLLTLCLEFWGESQELMVHILKLLSELYGVLDAGQFDPQMRKLVPKLAALFSTAQKKGQYNLVEPAFNVLQACGEHMQPHLPLLLPIMTRFIQTVPGVDIPVEVRSGCLRTLKKVLPSLKLNRSENYIYAGSIVLSLVNLLYIAPNLKDLTMDALCAVLVVFGPQVMQTYVEVVDQAMQHVQFQQDRRDWLNQFVEIARNFASDESQEDTESGMWRVRELERLKQNGSNRASGSLQSNPESNGCSESGDGFEMNVDQLSRTWDTTDRSTIDDWTEWIRLLSVELLRQSPSEALRACQWLAQVNTSVARRLFPASLMSCWSVLDDNRRSQLEMALRTALETPSIPTEVLQPVLSLEFLAGIGESVPSELQSLRCLSETWIERAKSQIRVIR